MLVEFGEIITGIRSLMEERSTALKRSSQDIHPLRVSLSDSFPPILRQLVIPSQGEGIVKILDTKDGPVSVDYSNRVIIAPPELYLPNHKPA